MPNPFFPGSDEVDTRYHNPHSHRVIFDDKSPPARHLEHSIANADVRDNYQSAHESMQQAAFQRAFLERDAANARGYLEYLEYERAREARAGVLGFEAIANQQRIIDQYTASREIQTAQSESNSTVTIPVAKKLERISASAVPPPIVTRRKHSSSATADSLEGLSPRLIGANSEFDAESEGYGHDSDCFSPGLSPGVSPDGVDGTATMARLIEAISPRGSASSSLQQFMLVRDRCKSATKARAESVPEALELDSKRTKSGEGPRCHSNSLTGA